jgi:hypothetical protein
MSKPTPHALGVSLGCDTSEALTSAQYAELASLGYRWICRYAPLAGMAPTAPGVLQAAELAALLAVGLGVMIVQFARSSGWSAAQGTADGKAAAAHVLALGLPPSSCVWLDLGVTPNAASAIAYANGWAAGAASGGLEASALGIYCEPGVPLTAEQRFQALDFRRYWATAADDAARFPAERGCQLIQLWASDEGEFQPLPGIEIDADVAQLDWFGNAPIASFATAAAPQKTLP